MPFIIILTLTIYIIALLWTWRNLTEFENKNKIVFIIITLIVNCIITFIIFNISKSGVNYENEQMIGDIRNILVFVFTGLNFLITAPYIGKTLNRVIDQTLEKEQFTKRVIIILVIFIICIFIECAYLKDIQEGIIQIYNSMAK